MTPRPRRRGAYILPSLFTAGNIGAGFYAIVQCLQASVQEQWHFNHAAIAILLAIPFDSLDGRVARMTNTASEFGREFDSLADVITFGVAPSVLAYTWGFRMLSAGTPHTLKHKLLQVGIAVCFLLLLCGASRLARFNVTLHPEPKNPGRPGRKYFVGMPIPAAAGIIAAFVHLNDGQPIQWWPWAVGWIGMVGMIGFLMVSTWRFWSGKEINFSSRMPFRVLLVLVSAGVLLLLFHRQTLLGVGLAYMCSGILARGAYSVARRRGRRDHLTGTRTA